MIILGAHEIYKKESTQIRDVSGIFKIHPDFDENTFSNDIALVKLSSPIKETDAIKIVKIAAGNNSFSGLRG